MNKKTKTKEKSGVSKLLLVTLPVEKISAT